MQSRTPHPDDAYTLSLKNRGKTLLLIGHESSQHYAQTFDPATGVRATSILRKR